MRRSLITLCLLVALPFTSSHARTTIVLAGRLIDGVSQTERSNVTIVIENGRFTDVVDGKPKLEADEVIDLSNQTVMPGLMDMHVHLSHQLSPKSQIEEFTLNPSDNAMRATAF